MFKAMLIAGAGGFIGTCLRYLVGKLAHYVFSSPFIIRKSKFPPNPERSVLFSGKRTKRSVQKKGCTQHL